MVLDSIQCLTEIEGYGVLSKVWCLAVSNAFNKVWCLTVSNNINNNNNNNERLWCPKCERHCTGTLQIVSKVKEKSERREGILDGF